MAKAIKREQEVVVISGSHKGKRGKVLSVNAGKSVVVEGVNMITKFLPKSQENPEGGSVDVYSISGSKSMRDLCPI